MTPKGRIVAITGAASGIGAALAHRFAAEGAAGLVLGDIQPGPLQSVARSIMADHPDVRVLAEPCDVTREADIVGWIASAEAAFGRVDIVCSNAGLVRDGDETTPDEVWALNWTIHVMANVWLARAVIPGMIARGEGCFMITASAAGLLSSMPSASYAVTKHASIAFAEKLAIDHGDRGLQVCVLCPQAVDTPLMVGRLGKGAALDGVLSADAVAASAIDGIRAGTFLILPHPRVLDYLRNKTADYDRWLAGMRRGKAKLREQDES
jgi:NAD(P)-dependent dehydrogenase (short-subunit alcohol dehydrogenase family)